MRLYMRFTRKIRASLTRRNRRSVRNTLSCENALEPTPKYNASNGMHDKKSTTNHVFKYLFVMYIWLYT